LISQEVKFRAQQILIRTQLDNLRADLVQAEKDMEAALRGGKA